MSISELYNKFNECSEISTDSRNITNTCMFFALKGDNFNGNKFALDAIKQGANYSIIDEKEFAINNKCILVNDVLETLQKLANYHRKQIRIPIIAITGTNGKTTTKELLTTVLQAKFNIKSTSGNFNNHIGVPLSLLGFTPDLDYGIIEMGANHPKEIELLCKIAEPDYGLITNIGKAHIEGFGSFEGVINTKNELYTYLKNNNKIIFYNSDNEILSSLIGDYANVEKYCVSDSCNVKGRVISASPMVAVEFSENSETVEISTNLVGTYNLENIVVACTIGSYFNMSLTEIKKAIESYVPTNNRSQLVEKGTNKIIVDAYNANATSMTNAIENIVVIESKNKVLILGDMLELGSLSEQEHKNILVLVEKLGFTNAYFVGSEFYKQKNNKYKFYKNTAELKIYLFENKIIDSLILLKGSRGIGLEVLLEYFD